ncbi:MAG TPA: hypothetical protein VL025_01780, partial [Thermoanaerobaculia bacterium]|nr:hypothetical protein [Thermoanaerobaculia bacterium]
MKHPATILLLLVLSLAACDKTDLPKDLSGSAAAAGASPGTSPAQGPGKGALLVLRRWQDPGELVLVGKGGVLSGPVGGPFVRTV